MKSFLVLSALILTLIANVNCLKLLLLFPIPVRSHYNLGNQLGRGLALLGHDVTVLCSFEDKNPPKNYKEIVINDFFAEKGPKNEAKFNMFDMEKTSPYIQLFFLSSVGGMMVDMTFEHPKVQNLLKSNQTFDVVIVEQFWNDAMKVFAHHFNAHLVAFSTVGVNSWINNLVANPENPSYVPNILLSFGEKMSFSERLYNFVFGLVSDALLYLYFYPSQNALMKRHFPNAPHLNDIQRNVSLVLTNAHESINAAVPYVPNMVAIGGYHVNPPKELPSDLQEFMDNAKEGVIYFSLGSSLVPSVMPKDKKDIILKVLGSRKEKVLWKWDEDNLQNKPNNFLISKWFPQQAILAHPNCKLFITHGGLLSLFETVYMGVPVLAFPIFGDQKVNAAMVKSKRFGQVISFSKIEENKLTESLNELLSNPIYREKAQINSKIMHDRPIKPIELAEYWIRYIVEHKGAPHLRVAGIKLPFYKYYMLDVFGAILSVLLLVIYLLKKLFGFCCRKSKPKANKSKRE